MDGSVSSADDAEPPLGPAVGVLSMLGVGKSEFEGYLELTAWA